MTELDELRRRYRDIRAPAAVTTAALARFRPPPRQLRWQPALAAAAVLIGAVAAPWLLERSAAPTNGLTVPTRDFPIPSLTALDLPPVGSLSIPRPDVQIQTPTLSPTATNEARNEV
jgi:hypothetical protein